MGVVVAEPKRPKVTKKATDSQVEAKSTKSGATEL